MLTDISRILQVRPDLIPQEMRDARRWVVWSAIPKLDRQGNTAEYTKQPRQPSNPNRKASSTNAETWADFETALEAVRRGEAHGLGFVLGDGWAGVDIDNAMTADGRRLNVEGEDVILRLQSYTELSPSGSGAHVIVRGQLPAGRKVENIEMYSSGRYFTVTGHAIPSGSPLVEPRQEELTALFEELGRRRAHGLRAARQQRDRDHNIELSLQGTRVPTSAEEIIEVAHRICRGFAALWAGDTSNYKGDKSRADLALAGHLAFVCGPQQHDLVRTLMEQSGLARDKYHESRPGGTYLDMTIRRVYEGRDPGRYFRWERSQRGVSAICEATPASAPDDGGQMLSLVHEKTLDDIGFSRRLAAESANRVRYVSDWHKWIYWDETRWQVDDGAAITREAQRLRDQLWLEYANLPNEQRTEQALRFIKACGTAKRIRDIVALTKNQQAIRIVHEQLDRHPYLFNVQNGTLELRTGAFRPHRQEDFLTQMAAVDYVPGAAAPLWEDFIAAAMQDDPELMRFLQVSAGLMLTGDVSPQLLWCHTGTGSNGKSTYLGALANMLGNYAVAAPSNFLMMKQGSSHPTEVAMLYGKRLVTAIECEGGQRMRESFVKMLTGGDKVAARRMNEDFWMMDPTWHLHVSYNTPPSINGTDEGIRRRLRVIPWRASFKGPNKDQTVKERLESEELRAGILNWCLAGLQDYLVNGIPGSVAIATETDEYVAGQDLFGIFLDECTEQSWEHCYYDEVIRAFHGWLESRGENVRLWNGKRVTNELKQRGYEKQGRSTSGVNRGRVLYRGLTLTVPVPPPS